MKYIICRDTATLKLGDDDWPRGGQIAAPHTVERLPLIFHEGITHSVMLEQLRLVYPGLEPLTAGFVRLTEDGWHCYGRSTSLNLDSDDRDGLILQRLLWCSIDDLGRLA